MNHRYGLNWLLWQFKAFASTYGAMRRGGQSRLKALHLPALMFVANARYRNRRPEGEMQAMQRIRSE